MLPFGYHKQPMPPIDVISNSISPNIFDKLYVQVMKYLYDFIFYIKTIWKPSCYLCLFSELSQIVNCLPIILIFYM